MTWAKEFGLLFVDNPVGTGFSTTGTTIKHTSHIKHTHTAYKQKTIDVALPVLRLMLYDVCVGSESGYASSELDVSRDLWALLQGFYNKYPALANNKLYVFGERSGHIGIHIIHGKDWFEPV